MNVLDIFAANLRKYRKEARLSQEKLAQLSGLHRTYIGGIEQRRVNVSLKNVGKIADALGIEPALLFECEDALDRPLDQAIGRSDGQLSNQSFEVSRDGFPDHSHGARGLGAPRSTSREAASCGDVRHALVMWEDGQTTVTPIQSSHDDLTVRILGQLVLDGYSGEELRARYEEINCAVTSLLAK